MGADRGIGDTGGNRDQGRQEDHGQGKLVVLRNQVGKGAAGRVDYQQEALSQGNQDSQDNNTVNTHGLFQSLFNLPGRDSGFPQDPESIAGSVYNGRVDAAGAGSAIEDNVDAAIQVYKGLLGVQGTLAATPVGAGGRQGCTNFPEQGQGQDVTRHADGDSAVAGLDTFWQIGMRQKDESERARPELLNQVLGQGRNLSRDQGQLLRSRNQDRDGFVPVALFHLVKPFYRRAIVCQATDPVDCIGRESGQPSSAQLRRRNLEGVGLVSRN